MVKCLAEFPEETTPDEGSVRGFAGASVLAAAAVFALVPTVNGQSKIACDPDNGGLKLPDGFCALVVANDLGPARHIAVAQNGDIYVAFQSRGGRGSPRRGGVIGLRDANGDGRFEIQEPIGTGSTTGVGLRNGYLLPGRTRRSSSGSR